MKFALLTAVLLLLTGCLEDACSPVQVSQKPDMMRDWGYMETPQAPGAFGR